MKALPLLFLLFCSSLAPRAFANADALKLVPGGKIQVQTPFETKVTTAAGTTIELGFADGELEEASGAACEKGDVFEPGEKKLGLKAAVDALKKLGKTLQGEWTYEQLENGEWVYDFEGTENKKNVDFILSAESGKLLKTEVDE